MTDAEKRIADRIAKNREIDERIARRGLVPMVGLRDLKVAFLGKDQVGFTHQETFPGIAFVIRGLCSPQNEFVSHRQIVSTMLTDSELGPLLARIVKKDPEFRTAEKWASDMMAWFSQNYTMGTNPFAEQFERDSTVEPYRYKLR